LVKIMSRIGRLPIKVPAGVEIKSEGTQFSAKGPKGQMKMNVHPNMKLEMADGEIKVLRPSDSKTDRALHGLTRSLVNNMIVGVTDGFSRQLNIVGVGYKADLKGKHLVLNLGFSHPIEYLPPAGIEFVVDGKKNTIVVKGIDKQKVGQVAAEVRSFRPPEPYKGKGVMYSTERIRRKAGKAAAGGKK
jgi:large subunit ribosomal protein L6